MLLSMCFGVACVYFVFVLNATAVVVVGSCFFVIGVKVQCSDLLVSLGFQVEHHNMSDTCI